MAATDIIFQVHETTGQSNLMVFNQSIAHCCFYNVSQMFYFYRLNFGRFLLLFALESTQQKWPIPYIYPHKLVVSRIKPYLHTARVFPFTIGIRYWLFVQYNFNSSACREAFSCRHNGTCSTLGHRHYSIIANGLETFSFFYLPISLDARLLFPTDSLVQHTRSWIYYSL